MVRLESSEGYVFEVEEEIAFKSPKIKEMCAMRQGTDEKLVKSVRIANVKTKILKKVIEWLEHHRNDAPNQQISELSSWDAKFTRVNRATLCRLIKAASDLKIEGLVQVTAMAFAKVMKGKSPEEIRKMLGIKNDLTPDEEEQIRLENELYERMLPTDEL
ncbi:S-phase kinase-associated protein 1-like protein [Leptotrombidium deliense]|uniref:S-phase kinase-associated protein 1-like protein n=1 Tax=Leptotrombidium deliense TaxID=299467 RepID=A0A443SJM0_9ACAR|nr:S-phase kinase-associated protein 1-like protein [Leptotrombidium deliense]